MKKLIVLVVTILVLSACAEAGSESRYINYYYDSVHDVSCYRMGEGLSCIEGLPHAEDLPVWEKLD
ncbi:hypothetical protein LCGC14_1546460 [marine sediment metagenome]|uniref:Lipoprotein n=1 Tax=marine sediment metagenome TaxID=412755 RepID=A0A0F9LSD7_9ZZZZ